MTSAAEKERQRRREAEDAWEHPDPVEARHVARAEERPASAQRVIDAVEADEDVWMVQEFASTIYGPPTWQRVKPSDAKLSLVAKPVTVYELGLDRLLRDGRGTLKDAQHQPHERQGRLMAIHVAYTDGRPNICRVGLQRSTGRLRGMRVAANRLGVVVRKKLAER